MPLPSSRPRAGPHRSSHRQRVRGRRAGLRGLVSVARGADAVAPFLQAAGRGGCAVRGRAAGERLPGFGCLSGEACGRPALSPPRAGRDSLVEFTNPPSMRPWVRSLRALGAFPRAGGWETMAARGSGPLATPRPPRMDGAAAGLRDGTRRLRPASTSRPPARGGPSFTPKIV
jgi:hypothetical protein